MKYYFLLSAVLIFCLTSPAQDKLVTYYQDAASNPPEVQIFLKHITAHISFVPEENKVIGSTEFLFTAAKATTDSIVFSAPGFKIKGVHLGNEKSTFWHQTGDNLVIVPSAGLLKYQAEDKIQIDYEAQPMKGPIYFVGWRPEEEGKRKAIWAHRPMGWLPYIDARVTMDMFYTFSGKYNVFANGERMEVKENADHTKTWHYKMAKNHPFFSTCVVIGDYDFKETKSKGGVPLEYWYYRGDEAKVPVTYKYTDEMMDFFERELDFKYPYALYRQAPVIDYMYGAMETTTATVFGDFMLIDPHAWWPRNYVNTNAHEMAHQWFGNYITHFVNQDVWLTESFATYYAKMFEKSRFGVDFYENSMNDEYNTVMLAAKNNNYPVGSSKGGVARIYQKGSLVMGMLRYVMGDTAFGHAVTAYLQQHPYKNAQQEDFFRVVYEATGNSYQWFFDEWILRGGEPAYRVEYSEKDDTASKRATYVHVWQTHETDDLIHLFRMPFIIEVHYKDGSMDSRKAWIEKDFHEIVIPNSGKRKIDFVLFDPGRNVLKKVTFSRSFEELSAQALKSTNMIDRYDALIEMRAIPVKTKKELLIKVYDKETFWLTKSEVISQLSADRTDESVLLFRKAIADEDAMVRKAVIGNVVPAPSSLQREFETTLNDFSYLNQELALQNLTLSFPEKKSEYLEQTKDLKGWRGLNIRMKWLEISIADGKKEFLPELIGYTSPKYEFETRINAFNTLKRMLYADEITVKNAKQASDHWNNKLSAAAKDYLTYFRRD